MKLSCPKCNKSLKIDDSVLGRKIKCPACAEVFPSKAPAPAKDENEGVVPSRKPRPAADDDEEAVRTKPKPSARRTREDEDDDEAIAKSPARKMAPDKAKTADKASGKGKPVKKGSACGTVALILGGVGFVLLLGCAALGYYYYDQLQGKLAQGPATFPATRPIEKPIPNPPVGNGAEQFAHLDLGTNEVNKEGVLRVRPKTVVSTKESYSGPIEVTVATKIEYTSLHIQAAQGAAVIIEAPVVGNWQLGIHRPDGNDQRESGSAGKVEIAKSDSGFFTLRWRITEAGLEVFVNDKKVFEEPHSYQLTGRQPVALTIGGDYGVDVKSVEVKALPPGEKPVVDNTKPAPTDIPKSTPEEEQKTIAKLRQGRSLTKDGALLEIPLEAGLQCVGFCPDGKLVALGDYNGNLRVIDLQTGKESLSLKGDKAGIYHLAFSPDGKLLAATTGISDARVVMWDLPSGTQRKPLGEGGVAPKDPGPVLFTRDGQSLLVLESYLSVKGDVKKMTNLSTWNLTTGLQKQKVMDLVEGSPVMASLSPDGKSLAIGTYEGNVWVGEVASGRKKWSGPFGKIDNRENALTFSPDGKLLAVGGGDLKTGFLKLLDAENGQVKHSLEGYEGGVLSLTFSPDGKLLISSGYDGPARFWEVETGKQGRKLDQQAPALFMIFSPAGAMLAWVRGGALLVWNAADFLNNTRETSLAELKKVADFDKQDDGYFVAFNEKATDASLALLKDVPGLKSLYLDGAPNLTEKGLANLKGLTSLRDLSMSYSQNFTDAGLANIKELTGLTLLNLSGTKGVTNAGLAHLAGLLNLKTLNLNGTGVTGAGLVHLKGLTALQHLNLTGQNVGESGAGYLAGLTDLRGLYLANTQMTDAGLSHLAKLSKLQQLSLEGNPGITGAGFVHLKGMPQLTHLGLANTKVTDAGLAHLKGLDKLASIGLEETSITDAGLEHLAALPALEDVSIGDVKGITGPGLKHLAKLPHLLDLNLMGTGVTDAGLAGVASLTQLEGLTLPEGVSDAGLVHLAGLKNLTSVQFSEAEKIKGPGLKHLKGLSKLQGLDLTTTGVDDAGLENLKELTQIKTLTLSKQITDKGLVHLKGLTQLAHLGAYSSQLSDAGLEQLKGLTSLESLSVSGPKITDKGLLELKGLKKLKFLSLNQTKVTDKGVQELKKLLPELEVSKGE
jgi:internalin A